MPRFGLSHRSPRQRPPRFVLGTAPRPEPPLAPLPWRKLGRITAVVGIVSAVAFSGWWLWSGSTLRVNTVIVVGTEVVDANAVIAAADVHGRSSITLDTGDVAKRIEQLPGVRVAAVHRDLPRSVVIEVQEQQSVGLLAGSGHPDGDRRRRTRPGEGSAAGSGRANHLRGLRDAAAARRFR